jgi:hypothetical protein
MRDMIGVDDCAMAVLTVISIAPPATDIAANPEQLS